MFALVLAWLRLRRLDPVPQARGLLLLRARQVDVCGLGFYGGAWGSSAPKLRCTGVAWGRSYTSLQLMISEADGLRVPVYGL